MTVPDKLMKKLIHQSNLIEGYDRKDADDQSLVAWHWLCDAGLNLETLHHNDITKLQKIITFFQDDLKPEWRGNYRKIPVYIGGREALPWILIEGSMDAWLRNLSKPETTAKGSHIIFEGIHPFADGNGRTGRMLMWWFQMKRDEELTPVLFDERLEYYKWFK